MTTMIKKILLPALLVSTCAASFTSSALADASTPSGNFNANDFMKQQALIISTEQAAFDKIATGGALANLKHCLKNNFTKKGCEIANLSGGASNDSANEKNSAPQDNNRFESTPPSTVHTTNTPNFYQQSAPKTEKSAESSSLPVNSGSSDNSDSSWHYKL